MLTGIDITKRNVECVSIKFGETYPDVAIVNFDNKFGRRKYSKKESFQIFRKDLKDEKNYTETVKFLDDVFYQDWIILISRLVDIKGIKQLIFFPKKKELRIFKETNIEWQEIKALLYHDLGNFFWKHSYNKA